MKKQWLWFLLPVYVLVLAAVVLTTGCEKSGEVENPLAAASPVRPIISKLKANSTKLSRQNGGILVLRFSWESPWVVSSVTAHLAFVQSVQDPITEPVGVISSGTASSTADPLVAPTSETLVASGTSTATETAAFYQRFATPLELPMKIGTDNLAGLANLELPLTSKDIGDAPLGQHQMLFWLTVNGHKTNSIAFEVGFGS